MTSSCIPHILTLSSSSVAELQNRITKVLTPIADKYNLSINSFGSVSEPDVLKAGLLTLSDAWGNSLEPAPITPTSLDSPGWQLLSGTIQSTHLTSKLVVASWSILRGIHAKCSVAPGSPFSLRYVSNQNGCKQNAAVHFGVC